MLFRSYQRIDVFQSPEFGKFLTLNGSVIFSEQDCFIYNEMVVHVPMSVHPDVKNVLIIGGGDGGVSKELLQYDNIENIDIVEQDNMFVDVCREAVKTTKLHKLVVIYRGAEMVAMLEDSFNKIAEIEDSKSVDIIVKIRSK